MGSLSIWHWIIVIVVVLLLFGGRGKISDLMGDVAQGIKAFKKGMSEDDKAAEPVQPSRPRPSITRRPPARRRRRKPSGAPRACALKRAYAAARWTAAAWRPTRPGVDQSMFDIGWGELVVIGVVALIAIGPKELPTVLRTVGQWMGKIRRMATEFQGQFQEAMREAEMADLKKQADELAQHGQRVHQLRSAGRRAERRRARFAADAGGRDQAGGAPSADAAARKPAAARWRHAAGAALLPPAIDVPLPEPPAPVTEKDFAPAEPASAPAKPRSRPRAAHEPRGHRGHQGAADGAPDRAALAADQGAARLRRDVRALLLLRQAHLQRPGLALRAGGGRRRIRNSSTPRCSNISSRSSSSRCSARPSCRFRWWRRRSTCSSRPASTATSARRSCRI